MIVSSHTDSPSLKSKIKLANQIKKFKINSFNDGTLSNTSSAFAPTRGCLSLCQTFCWKMHSFLGFV